MQRITEYLVDDHVRLGALLDRARAGDVFDHEAYAGFRAGLLRHIAIEEKILFPAVRPLSRAPVLREAHARICALLAPAPTATRCEALAAILVAHDADEEGPDGVYAECEERLGETLSQELAVRAREHPAVRVAPYRQVHP